MKCPTCGTYIPPKLTKTDEERLKPLKAYRYNTERQRWQISYPRQSFKWYDEETLHNFLWYDFIGARDTSDPVLLYDKTWAEPEWIWEKTL